MKNPLVTGREAQDIQDSVKRLLLDIGDPEPPLNLDIVRDWLKLDRHYYSTKDPSKLQEFIHNLRVGTKQFAKRPMLLVEAIRTLSLRALYFPDTKRILIDEDLPKLKYRWTESHEIGHSLIWWHKDYLLGDSDYELSPSCHAVIEAEANFASGQLLFLQDHFLDDLMSVDIEFKNIRKLYNRYKNTLTSTFWRFIESHRGNVPLVGVVSGHPKHPDDEFDALEPCKHTIQSPVFREQFSNVSEVELFAAISSYCWSHTKGGPLGSGEVLLTDVNGNRHLFEFESFNTTYEILTLGKHIKKLPTSGRRSA